MATMWERLGFKHNPYFTAPIDITPNGRELFVGRGREVRRMINKWSGEPSGCITVIGGNIGTGKTSFLNVCQYLTMTGTKDFELAHEPPLIMPCFTKVQMEMQQTQQELVFRILRTAIESVTKTCDFLQEDIPTSIKEKAAWIDSIISSSSRSVSVGTGLGVHDGPSASVSLGYSGGKSFKNVGDVPLEVLISSLAEVAEIATTIRDYEGIIIAIDNLEMIDSQHVIEMLNSYRDTLFSVPKIWWVLIGQKGLYDLINANAERVAQRIKGMETTLDGLSWEDFLFATQLRIDEYKIRETAVAPIDESLLKNYITHQRVRLDTFLRLLTKLWQMRLRRNLH